MRSFVIASSETAQAEVAAGEGLVANLIARAYAADHPELFPVHGQIFRGVAGGGRRSPSPGTNDHALEIRRQENDIRHSRSEPDDG